MVFVLVFIIYFILCILNLICSSFSRLLRLVRGGDERSYPASEVRGGGQEELPHAPKPKAKGGGREEQPHVQGAVAARQEGLEELSHVEGQEGRW